MDLRPGLPNVIFFNVKNNLFENLLQKHNVKEQSSTTMSTTPRKTTPQFCKCQHFPSIIATFFFEFQQMSTPPIYNCYSCSQMLPNAPRCPQMLPDAARCSQMPPDAARCCQILPEAATCSQMLPNAPKHLCMTLGTRATCIYIYIYINCQ